MKYVYATLGGLFCLLSFSSVGAYISLSLGLYDSGQTPVVLPETEAYYEAMGEIWGECIFSLLFVFVFIWLTGWSFGRYHRSCRRKKGTPDPSTIQGPFVLYLRSFADDDKTRRGVSSATDVRTEEEQLVSVMTDIAPVYAIGDPKDRKMPLGASRVYVDDEHWKSTVEDLAHRAMVVVLRLGHTDSFWWEVEMALRHIPLSKLLFIVPHTRTFSNVSTLYKLLLEHGVDIGRLDVNIGRQRRGSISSILYFDDQDKPQTTEVRSARFTGLFISYEQVLRNALAGFRAKFGLPVSHRLTVRKARVFQAALILCLLFVGGSRLFGKYVDVRYQMPYELAEACTQDSVFAARYSDQVNGTNLTWAIVESGKGMFALDDEDFLFLVLVEGQVTESMSTDEFYVLNNAPQNLLLMVRKYAPDFYTHYVDVLTHAALMAVYSPDDTTELIGLYQESTDLMPQWLTGLPDNFGEADLGTYEFALYFHQAIMKHIDDEGLADALKVWRSQFL